MVEVWETSVVSLVSPTGQITEQPSYPLEELEDV